jgi:DNA-binding transcriptional ArsR family regulator
LAASQAIHGTRDRQKKSFGFFDFMDYCASMKLCGESETREACLFRRHAEFCHVFSNPLRLRLLFLLGDGERAVTEMAESVGAPMPAVSQHLRIMRNLGCVETRRDGRTVYYRVASRKFLRAAVLIREGIVEQASARARAVEPAPTRLSARKTAKRSRSRTPAFLTS